MPLCASTRAVQPSADEISTNRRTKCDWAEQIGVLLDVQYPRAERVTLVMDNRNTPSLASLYEAFEAGEARRLIDRLEVVCTPKPGS